MKRDLFEVLYQWKRDANRRPLLVRGARQVGKTYLVNLLRHLEKRSSAIIFVTINNYR